MHEVDKPEHLNTSSLRWFEMFFKPVFAEEELLSGVSWVDVRDVAEAHVVALEKEDVANERIIVTAPAVANQEFIEAAKRAAASLGIKGIQTGVSNYDPAGPVRVVRFSDAKMNKLLGIKITSMDDSVRDTIADFRERGWIPA